MAVRELHLEMDPEDVKWSDRHPSTDRCFSGYLRSHDGEWPIWLSYRGRFSRQLPKRSYDIWLQSGHLPDGSNRLHLNAAYRDPSCLRGRLAFAIFEDLGVITPHSSHVWLTLNGEPLGLYTAIEALDGDWLRRQGKSGAIYYGVGGDGNFGLLSRKDRQPKRSLAAGYEKCYPYNDDFSDLVDLILRITLPESPEFEEQINEVIHVDRYLRWLAGVVFTSHTDGLVHNYALIRPTGDRWQLSPWDCDGTLGRTPYGHPLPADHMPVSGGSSNYLSVRLLSSQRWRMHFRELLGDTLDATFSFPTVEEHLQALYAEIRDWALMDGKKWRTNSTFLREPSNIRHWIAQRRAFIRQELDAGRP